MSDSSWATLASALVLLVALTWLAYDRRALTQKLRNAEGAVAGMRLDVAAVTDRVVELQSYLSDPESWRISEARPVPPALADPVLPDRCSPIGAHSGPAGRQPQPSRMQPSRIVRGPAAGQD